MCGRREDTPLPCRPACLKYPNMGPGQVPPFPSPQDLCLLVPLPGPCAALTCHCGQAQACITTTVPPQPPCLGLYASQGHALTSSQQEPPDNLTPTLPAYIAADLVLLIACAWWLGLEIPLAGSTVAPFYPPLPRQNHLPQRHPTPLAFPFPEVLGLPGIPRHLSLLTPCPQWHPGFPLPSLPR